MSTPSRSHPERVLGDAVVFKGQKVRVLSRRIDLGNGHIVQWEIVDKGWDSAAMVAIDDDRNVYLVEEYFGAIDERALCLPKGKIAAGEQPLEAARRELQEEVGLDGEFRLLSRMSLSPGYLTQRTFIYLVLNVRTSRMSGDEVQYIRPVRITLTDAVGRCLSGEISEARTVAGILLAERFMAQIEESTLPSRRSP